MSADEKAGTVASKPMVYRVMTPEKAESGCEVPKLGPTARTLGARVPSGAVVDVTPDGKGEVGPDRFHGESREGMSVAPDIASLPFNRVPERLLWLRPDARGKDEDRVFRLGSGGFSRTALNDDLEFVPDESERPAEHGVIQPTRVMPIAAYQQALGATQGDWEVDEPAEKSS